MKKFLKIIGVSLMIVIGLIGVNFLNKSNLTEENQISQNKLKISTSFYPLYFFATQIGKNLVEVTNLTPAGAEPHDFEPNAQDLAGLATSNIVLANGAGFEHWLQEVEENLQTSDVKVFKTAEQYAFLKFKENGVEVTDPHIWLDPVLAIKMTEMIAQAMVEADPLHQTQYESNTEILREKLFSLDSEFKQGLNNCEHKKIITSHQAFGYLASRYELQQFPVVGLAPDQEPSPAELAKIIELVKNEGVKYIFFETLVSPRIAETIAAETGAQTLVFDPIEGVGREAQQAGEDYFSIQRNNLKNLKLALNCQ